MSKTSVLISSRWKVMMATLVGALLAALLLVNLNGGAAVDSPSRLVGAGESSEALVEAYLVALQKQDEESIRAITLSREEFERFVWPELPASDPRTNLTSSFVWEQMHLRSRSSEAAIFFRNKGRDLKFVGLRYAGEVDPYSSYTIHQDPVLTVLDESGKQEEIALFGSVIEMDGQFKIFSFAL